MEDVIVNYIKDLLTRVYAINSKELHDSLYNIVYCKTIAYTPYYGPKSYMCPIFIYCNKKEIGQIPLNFFSQQTILNNIKYLISLHYKKDLSKEALIQIEKNKEKYSKKHINILYSKICVLYGTNIEKENIKNIQILPPDYIKSLILKMALLC